MGGDDRSKVGLAAKLLAKAESTDSHEEAVSLTLRAYSTLADWLSACESHAGGARRRERRLLRDRRALGDASGRLGIWPGPLGAEVTPLERVVRAGAYKGLDPRPARSRNIDLRL